MQVIGHRGAAALAPENTWASFDVALELGVDAIETDVRATSDGELVLIHDERLDRTTDSQGLIVHKTSWSVIQTLDAGSWFSAEFRGARVPRLLDTLERFGRSAHLVLEIKQPGIELAVLEMVHELGLLNNVTFTSFQFEAANRIKANAPLAKVGFLSSDVGPSNVQRALDARLDQFCPPAISVTRSLVSEWKRLGLEVRAWGVKDTDIMMRAVEAGVDGMTVDFPHLLLEVLGRHHPFIP
jgi:glycerophosphoryl diester phosphodiesterase